MDVDFIGNNQDRTHKGRDFGSCRAEVRFADGHRTKLVVHNSPRVRADTRIGRQGFAGIEYNNAKVWDLLRSWGEKSGEERWWVDWAEWRKCKCRHLNIFFFFFVTELGFIRFFGISRYGYLASRASQSPKVLSYPNNFSTLFSPSIFLIIYTQHLFAFRAIYTSMEKKKK